MEGSQTKPAGKKEKILHELRQLVAIFLYLAAFFLVLRTYTHLVLLDLQVAYVAYGLTILKALALSKIILTGETLRLGRRFDDRPLIIATLYNTSIFSLFALAFEIVEHLVLDAVHGESLGGSFATLMQNAGRDCLLQPWSFLWPFSPSSRSSLWNG